MERSSNSKLRIKISKLIPFGKNSNGISPPLIPHKPSPPMIVSLIPCEARMRPNYGTSFDTREPTSPKVSCLGHLNIKKNRPNTQPKVKPKGICCAVSQGKLVANVQRKVAPKVDELEENKKLSLGSVKRFVSGRGGVLHDFDWTRTNNPEFVSRDTTQKVGIAV